MTTLTTGAKGDGKEAEMTCPKCGKRMICEDSRDILPNVRKRRYHCRNCGLWAWSTERIYYTDTERSDLLANGGIGMAKDDREGLVNDIRRSEADANDG